jgi:hypothetical protein
MQTGGKKSKYFIIHTVKLINCAFQSNKCYCPLTVNVFFPSSSIPVVPIWSIGHRFVSLQFVNLRQSVGFLVRGSLVMKGWIYFTDPLSNNNRRVRHIDTRTYGRNLWRTSLRWVQLPWYSYQISYRLVQAFKCQNGESDWDTQTALRSHKPTFICQNKEIRLKMK